MKLSNNQQAFLELVKAGLWEREAYLTPYGDIDFQEIYRLAQEQTVVGLVAAGVEHVIDIKPPQDVTLLFVGDTLQYEQRNKEMNCFIGKLFDKLLPVCEHLLLVKGQGIAQCYERPLWRMSGDIDILISSYDYNKTRDALLNIVDRADKEVPEIRHQGVIIGLWEVELHGSLRGLWSPRVDRAIDKYQKECFEGEHYRIWDNEEVEIALPSVDYDLVFVFTHILQHFFRGGLGLRQICDMARLIWTYNRDIDVQKLDMRLREMGLQSEWNVFAALCVDLLGMPVESMPLYSSLKKWKRKAERLLLIVLGRKNIGFMHDNNGNGFLTRKLVSLGHHTSDFIHHYSVFPLDAIMCFCRLLGRGLHLS